MLELYQIDDFELRIFLIFVVTSMLTGGALTSMAHLPSFSGYMVAAVLPMIAAFLWHGTTTARLIAGMSVVHVGVLTMTTGTANRGIADLIALQLVAIELPDLLPPVLVDELRLKQVVLNLLSNAIKFSHSGGAVEITTGRSGALALIVRDHGIGMTAAEIEIALEPFRQVDSALSRRYAGTGLGLPLAKSLIERHGGRLAIESERGVGTAVTVTLPSWRVMPASAERPRLAAGVDGRACPWRIELGYCPRHVEKRRDIPGDRHRHPLGGAVVQLSCRFSRLEPHAGLRQHRRAELRAHAPLIRR